MNNAVEVWKPIPGYEKYYEASSLGRIRSLDRVNNDGHLYKGRVLKGVPQNKGYLSLWLSVNGVKKRWLVHRLVAMTFIENRDNKAEVNHKNGVCNDNRVDNLEWVTSSQNKVHSFKELGRVSPFKNLKGKPNAHRKLTDEQADAIRRDNRSQRVIANDYQVSVMTIHNIKSGKLYKTKAS